MGDYKGNKQLYAAFLSYAHEDDAIAQRVQKSLETYALPKNLKQYADRLSPIFRDVTELIASHSLTDRITDAVENSRFLIVLCSPASKASHWVNEEIRLFRRLHGEESIFCALIEGSPATSFPPALTEDGREPLAADMTGQKESFKFGITQIAASMLNVGLDDLILRKRQRYRRRVMLITASAITALLMMGALTWTAMDARQLAEQRRVDAEELIEFMLTDLRDDLDAVGSLDALQAVGDRAASYYDNYKLSEHDDDALGRRANVFQLLGKTQDRLGNFAEANRYFQEAYLATEYLLDRDPSNPDRIFDHSQSAFWIGYLEDKAQNYEGAQIYLQIYLDLAQRLKSSEGETERAKNELVYAYNNLGNVALALGETEKAAQILSEALSQKKLLVESSPENVDLWISLIGAYGQLGAVHLENEDLLLSLNFFKQSLATIDAIEAQLSQPHADVSYQKLKNLRIVSRLNLLDNNLSEAQKNITSGIALVEDNIRLDPKNIGNVFEDIQLRYMAFELAFLNGNTELAKNIHGVIQTKIDGYPKSTKNDYNYETLKTIQFSSDLYLSILLPNLSKRETVAAQIQYSLLEYELNEFQSLKKNQHLLTPVILVSKIANTDVFHDAINQLCKDPSAELSFGSKMKLRTYIDLPNCPTAKSKQDRTALILQKAMTELDNMTSNVVNQEKNND